MKIKNIEELRNHILDSLVQLEKGKIDVSHAAIIAKSGEAIMSSVKLQLMYSQMIGHEPKVDFLQDCHEGKKIAVIEQPKIKQISAVK